MCVDHFLVLQRIRGRTASYFLMGLCCTLEFFHKLLELHLTRGHLFLWRGTSHAQKENAHCNYNDTQQCKAHWEGCKCIRRIFVAWNSIHVDSKKAHNNRQQKPSASYYCQVVLDANALILHKCLQIKGVTGASSRRGTCHTKWHIWAWTNIWDKTLSTSKDASIWWEPQVDQQDNQQLWEVTNKPEVPLRKILNVCCWGMTVQAPQKTQTRLMGFRVIGFKV